MIDVSNLLNRLESCAHDDTLYLLEIISEGGGIFALNGNIVYMSSNDEGCNNISIRTEYLHLETNIHISAFSTNCPSFKDGNYNTIELYILEGDESVEKLKAFINLCCTYASHLEETDFVSFFDSLVTLFQLPKEQTYKNLVGVYGELSLIDYFYDKYKVDLSKYWHTEGVSSKLDFVANSFNIEVKSTPTEELKFLLKHEQLFGNNKKTYLAAISLCENNSGITFDELANKLLSANSFCSTLEFAINLEAERRRVSPRDASEKRFVLKDIRLYDSEDICPFRDVPENITNLSYNINLIKSRCVNPSCLLDNV